MHLNLLSNIGPRSVPTLELIVGLCQCVKTNPCGIKHEQIKALNKELKTYYNMKKAKRVRKCIVPGNTSSIWKAVNIAKDLNSPDLPKVLSENGVQIHKLKIKSTMGKGKCLWIQYQ